jgi:predicted DNA-binding ribbon-helix-helix protein
LGKDGQDAHRVSVTFSRAQHAELARIAGKHGMTVAWLVRRAAERLIEQENGGPMLPLELASDARG